MELSMFALSDRVAIVTGGGKGIGRAIALGLARAGAKVAIADIAISEANQVAGEIESLGRECLVSKCDVKSSLEVNDMTKEVLDKFGRIDILVNNAGITKSVGPAEETKESDWDEVIDVNLKGLFLCSQAVGKVMIKQKKGKIINIASMAGQIGLPKGSAAYCASKGGVISLTRILAVQWAKYNINVNAIAPTFVYTPLIEGILKSGAMTMEDLVSGIPLGRIAQPEDIVGAAIFLASDASNMVTGHILNVDGGYVVK